MKKNKLFLLSALSLIIACLPGIKVQAAEVEGWGSFKLYLDPGHSGRENQGLWGYSEAEKVLAVALNIQDMFKTYTDMPDACLKLCRYTQSESKTLEERTDEANAWGADFYYSIHSDASGNNNTTVTLFGGWRKNGVNIEKTPNGGKAFGEILNPNLTNAMRITTRGNYYDRCYYYPNDETHANQYPYLHVNRESNMPSLLSEGGYHTIASQQQLNINADYKRIEAFAAFRSILKYRGLSCPVQTFLTGIITNSENDVPINGVTVTVDGKTYTTDTWESVFNKYTRNPNLIHNGYYFFEGLTPGQQYEVTYEAEGFNTETRTVTIKQSDDGEAADNITFQDLQMTSNAPAKVDGISVSDFSAVNPTKPITITFSRNMNRESVEQATSINRGNIVLSWENDYTLNIDVSQLSNLYVYKITIDGSIARNSQTNQLFDGDGDGTEGGNYVIDFTMAEPDVEPPYVVSADPTPEGESLYTTRPPIRIEFNEELAWNDDLHANLLTVSDKDGNVYSGTVVHAVEREASVIHLYFNQDLPLDRTILV
ncbi:MAG: N-acetylmuramoyl-L-alanine amidase, partial [Muribaculaceae bacterium]|nr:N-acetylmuramoyl-L-alanine amidase [Muribaculaceae bacterium]